MIDRGLLLDVERSTSEFQRYLNAMRLADPHYYTTPDGLAKNIAAMRYQLDSLEDHLVGLYGEKILEER